MHVYIYIYIYIYMCVCVNIYIYIERDIFISIDAYQVNPHLSPSALRRSDLTSPTDGASRLIYLPIYLSIYTYRSIHLVIYLYLYLPHLSPSALRSSDSTSPTDGASAASARACTCAARAPTCIHERSSTDIQTNGCTLLKVPCSY